MNRFLFPVVISFVLAAGAAWGFWLLTRSPAPSFEVVTTIQESASDAQTPVALPDHPVIYATVFTHNEDGLGPSDPDYTKDEDEFRTDRESVIEFATMLKEHEVSYDFQSDWNFLLAIDQFDRGTESTDGKNVLRYLAEDLGAQIDAHSHQSMGYNMADVAYLISTLGVTPSNIVGGMIAAPPEESLLEDFWKPIKANKADYTWTAQAIWGGGTGLHQDEEALWTSGVWRPKSKEDYLVHDPDAPIPAIGHYHSSWEGLDDLLARLHAGELEAGEMYTIALDAHQREMNEAFLRDFEEHLLAYQDEVDDGEIVWATLDEVLEIWQTVYQEQPTIYAFIQSATQEDETTTPSVGDTANCGDGTCSVFERKSRVCPLDCN
jgi:hypothetical protein